MPQTCKSCNVEKPISEFMAGNITSKFCKECKPKKQAERAKNYQREYKGVARKAMLMRKHGITAEIYDQMFAAQGGRCLVCGIKPEKEHLHVDHDHKTGRVRALLCGNCNSAIAFCKDDPQRLRALALYLERSR